MRRRHNEDEEEPQPSTSGLGARGQKEPEEDDGSEFVPPLVAPKIEVEVMAPQQPQQEEDDEQVHKVPIFGGLPMVRSTAKTRAGRH